MVEVNARYAVQSRHLGEEGEYWVAFAWFTHRDEALDYGEQYLPGSLRVVKL